MKRVLSLFLALVLCLSLLPTAAFADGVSITATASKQAPAIGETIDVTFTVANNPGFTNVQLQLAFDSNVLKFTGLKQEANSYGQMVTAGLFGAGTSEANTVVGNEKYGSIGYINTNAINVDNTLFVAQFEVIGQGATTVGAVVQQFQNASGDTVASYEPVVSETGSITVAGIPATGVTLDKTELSLEEGANYLLTATVDPADTTDEIVWSSSDPNVATVVNGQVKAVSAGTATITAKANDSASATCAVTVTAEQSIVHKSPDGYSGITATAEMTGVKSLVVGGSTKTVKNIYKLPLTGHEEAWVHMDGAGSGQGAAYKLDGTAVFGVPNGVDLNKFFINIGNVYTPDLLVTEAELTAAVGEDNVSKLGLSEDKLYAFLYIEDPWKNRNSGILFEITPVAATGVEVQETMSLYEGESGELSVSVLPATNTDGLTVTYSSDSEAVATVDENGKVTAVAPGTAVITVTAGSYTDTCTVTVKSGFTEIENVPGNGDNWAGRVTGITIKNVTVDSYQWNGKTLNVFIAEDTATATVVFNFNHNGYDNKHEETAAITNGSGTLTKTFTHSDGWDSYETTWVINFTKSVPATSIELDKTTLELTKGSDATLTATLSKGATDTVTWSSSDENVATVDKNGKVTAVGGGTATITATAHEGLTATCTVNVPTLYSVQNIPQVPTFKNGTFEITSLEIDANVESAAWDGDTLNVVLAEGTATDAAISTIWTVKAQNTWFAQDEAHYFFNGNQYGQGATPVTNVHTLAATLTDGAGTATATFEGRGADCCDDQACDLSFPAKTYTVNFTVAEAGGEEPAPTVALPFTLSMDGNPVAVEVQADQVQCTAANYTAHLLKVTLPAADMDKDMVMTCADDANVVLVVNNCTMPPLGVLNAAYTPTYTFKPSTFPEHMCAISQGGTYGNTAYHIVFEAAGGSTEPEQPTVALPFTLTMDGNPVAIEVQTGKEYCGVYEKDAAILKIKLPAADMEKEMVLSKSADVNMLYINPLCDWQNATQINQYNPDYTFKPSEYAEYLCVENISTEETYHIVFESEGGSTEPEQPTANPITSITLSYGETAAEPDTENNGVPTITLDLGAGASKKLSVDITAQNPEEEATQVISWVSSNSDLAWVDADGYLKTASVITAAETVTLSAYAVDSTAAVMLADAEAPQPLAAIKVNLTATATDKYTVAVGGDQELTAADSITVPVFISHAADTSVNYNAYELVFTYDPAYLTLKTESTETETRKTVIVDNNGNVTIRSYGDPLTPSEQVKSFELAFEAVQTGTSTVTLTDAKVGTSTDAQTIDVPDAALGNNASRITVTGYNVNLDKAFTGPGTVNPNAAYTFNAVDPFYDYTVTATYKNADGQDVSVNVTDNEDGTYTIDAGQIKGDLTIKLDTEVGKKFNVTIDGNGQDQMSPVGEGAFIGDDAAQYMKDYAVKLTSKGEGYSYEVAIKIGNEEYAITPDNGVYTIQGKDITGNITITVTETAPTVEDHTVTFQGSGVDDVTSGTENQKVAHNGTYTFNLKPVDGYEYSVSAVVGTEAKTVTKTGEANDDGSYTYTVADITANLTITIEKSDLKVEVNEYVVLKGDETQNESDKVVYLVTATQTLDDNKTLGYNISESETADYKPMYLKTYTVKETNAETGEESSRKVQMYSYLVILEKNDAFNEEVAAEKIAVLNVAPTVLPETFNVNKSNVTEGNAVGTVDINDAQLVYDMYNAMYKAFDNAVSMEKFLLADVNGDRTIGVQDAAAIVTEILK